MKKFLITITPLCVVLFVLMWISWGLKGVLAFFGAMLFIVALAFGLDKWVEFVDKHIKD
jgi:Ca2+/H+ antiporter